MWFVVVLFLPPVVAFKFGNKVHGVISTLLFLTILFFPLYLSFLYLPLVMYATALLQSAPKLGTATVQKTNSQNGNSPGKKATNVQTKYDDDTFVIAEYVDGFRETRLLLYFVLGLFSMAAISTFPQDYDQYIATLPTELQIKDLINSYIAFIFLVLFLFNLEAFLTRVIIFLWDFIAENNCLLKKIIDVIKLINYFITVTGFVLIMASSWFISSKFFAPQFLLFLKSLPIPIYQLLNFFFWFSLLYPMASAALLSYTESNEFTFNKKSNLLSIKHTGVAPFAWFIKGRFKPILKSVNVYQFPLNSITSIHISTEKGISKPFVAIKISKTIFYLPIISYLNNGSCLDLVESLTSFLSVEKGRDLEESHITKEKLTFREDVMGLIKTKLLSTSNKMQMFVASSVAMFEQNQLAITGSKVEPLLNLKVGIAIAGLSSIKQGIDHLKKAQSQYRRQFNIIRVDEIEGYIKKLIKMK